MQQMLKIGDVISVNGHIMLSKIDGVMRLISEDSKTYTFAKGKNGKKPYVRHYKMDIDFYVERGMKEEDDRDYNYIEVL